MRREGLPQLQELKVENIVLQEESVLAMMAVVAKQVKVEKLCRNYFHLIP